MSRRLSIRAGSKALTIIRDGGFHPDRIKVLAGAAGGPKWLVLSQLDRAIFGQWFKGRQHPLFLIGASIGAWRFTAACRNHPLDAIERFEQAYVFQTYSAKPSLAEISRESMKIQKDFLDESNIREVLDHPCFRLNVLTARCRRLVGTDQKAILGLGLAAAALLNLISRNALKFFFERTLFSDPRDIPPFFNMRQFPIRKTPLTPANIRQAVLASGSIPLVMSGVRDIPGAVRGTYRDGALIDYHLDIPFVNDDSLVLFPHFQERIIPGWFDKKLKWRRPHPAHMAHVVLVAPSPEFVEKLPLGKIPDRDDFYLFNGRDRERFDYWWQVVHECRALAHDFMDAVNSGRIRSMVRAL